jgi:RNA polymerase sigma-70 factor (ECF subfamily)
MDLTQSEKMKKNEKELVVRLTRDDESAFCELYAQYKNRLFYFAMQYLKSAAFAEDVYQDAFAAVWQTRRFIDPELPFSTYLYTIVRNRILNLLRNMDTESNLKNHILSQALDYTEETQDTINENDLTELLAQAMSELTGKQRTVFEMSRNQGLSQKEIAAQLDISVTTVKSHLSAALKTLQEYIRKHYDASSGLILILFCLNS